MPLDVNQSIVAVEKLTHRYGERTALNGISLSVRKGESLENRIGLTERDIIEQALLSNNFSRTNTARHLGISRVTLYNKMRKYGILPER